MNPDDFEERLRATLYAHAARAPQSPNVERRLLDEVLIDRSARTSRWRTWIVPMAAAAAVAVVAATVVGVQHYRPSAERHVTPPAGSVSSSPSLSSSFSPSPSNAPTQSPSTALSTLSASHAVVSGVSGFVADDLTYVGSEAWALGTTASGCDLLGCLGTLLHTTDGVKWKRLTAPQVRFVGSKGCSQDCAIGVRFATPDVGYIYGTDLLYMTTNAGTSWQRLSGGAVALETLDSNVIRVDTQCFPGCPITVQTAALGSTAWTTRALPGSIPGMDSGVSLVRVSGAAYLAVYGHPAGGAGLATSALFISTDDGTSWTNHGEPCPQTGGGAAGNEVDTTAIAAGGGWLVAVCTPRGGTSSFLIASGDRGADFQPGASTLTGAGNLPIAVAPHAVLVATTDGLYRSTNVGDTWQQVPIAGMDSARWLGFESLTDGRLVSADGSTIWTTHDAGAHWSAITFPS